MPTKQRTFSALFCFWLLRLRSKLLCVRRINADLRTACNGDTPLNPNIRLRAHILFCLLTPNGGTYFAFQKFLKYKFMHQEIINTDQETPIGGGPPWNGASQGRGRPEKSPKVRKRNHYSVWATDEQKRLLDIEILQSNMSASQFFITQVIQHPVKRPKKKTLPKAVVDKIINLEKLSGLLALSVLKTKDIDFVSKNWLQSSQDVKLLVRIIFLWIFEDFELPSLKKDLKTMQNQILELNLILETVFGGNQKAIEVTNHLGQIYHKVKKLLLDFDRYYLNTEMPIEIKELQMKDSNIHFEIKKLVELYLTPPFGAGRRGTGL